MYRDFDYKDLKPYKGYGIQKAWWIDDNGERIRKYPYFYLVSDDKDYISPELPCLAEAKKFIDDMV